MMAMPVVMRMAMPMTVMMVMAISIQVRCVRRAIDAMSVRGIAPDVRVAIGWRGAASGKHLAEDDSYKGRHSSPQQPDLRLIVRHSRPFSNLRQNSA